MATKIITHEVQQQLSQILNQISHNALAIKDMTNEGMDADTFVMLSTAIGALAEKIGIAADLGDKKLGGNGVVGDAEQWLMPPAYFTVATATPWDGHQSSVAQ